VKYLQEQLNKAKSKNPADVQRTHNISGCDITSTQKTSAWSVNDLPPFQLENHSSPQVITHNAGKASPANVSHIVGSGGSHMTVLHKSKTLQPEVIEGLMQGR